MKNDRELLELAAKAAQYQIAFWPDGECGFIHAADGGVWNSLKNDGDALRLAVKRRIKVRYNEALGQALAWPMGAKEAEAITVNIEDCDGDELAATRRAITIAAAIGEAMQ